MSPSNSSPSPKTDQRLNAIAVAVEEKRTMTNPIQGSPQEVVHEANDPKQASPQEVVPKVNNPQEVVPEVNNLKQGSPQEVVHEVNNPKQVSPQEFVHEVNNPMQVFPQDVMPEVNNPKQGSPQELVPDLNNPKQGSPQEIVPERKKTERPSVDLRVFRSLNKLMKKYPSRDNHALICNICKRGFPNAHSLGSHQKSHKHEFEWKLKHVDPSYSPGQSFWRKPDNSYLGMSNSVHVGGSSQNALSNGTHLGISRGSVRNMDIGQVMGYPSAPPYGRASYGFSSGAPLVTHNYNRSTVSNLNRSDLSFGPFKPNGASSNNNYPSLFNGGFTTPTTYPPFIVNPSYGSLPTYSYGPHDSNIMNSIGSCSNNNSSSQGEISLELTLGPSKWMGGSNNNGVTGGHDADKPAEV